MGPRYCFRETIPSLKVKKAITRHPKLDAHSLQFTLSEGQPLLNELYTKVANLDNS